MIRDGDEVIALAALHLAATGRLGGGVAVTVMSNYGFHNAMSEAGIEVATTAVGDRNVTVEMDAREWSLGGEQSGHVIWTEFAPTGDGIAAALLTLAALGDGGLAEATPMSAAAPGARQRAGGRPRRCRRVAGACRGDRARERRAGGPRPSPGAAFGHRAADPGDGRGARGGRGAEARVRAVGCDRGAKRGGAAPPLRRLVAIVRSVDCTSSLPFTASCAESLATSDNVPVVICSSRASRSWSTGGMTRPASRCSPTATSTRSAPSATSPTCGRSSAWARTVQRRGRGRSASGDDRPRAYPLGDPRPRHRGERAPTRRLLRPGSDRPQRDRREPRRPAQAADRRGSCLFTPRRTRRSSPT